MKLRSIIGLPTSLKESSPSWSLVRDAKDKELTQELLEDMSSLRSFTDTLVEYESPLRNYLEEVHKAYVGRAFGAAVVYCGISVEYALCERVLEGRSNTYTEKQLLDAAIQSRVLETEVRATVEMLLAARNYHAHPMESLREGTKRKYDAVEKHWGALLVEGDIAKDANIIGHKLDPYNRDTTLEVVRRMQAVLACLVMRSPRGKL